MAETSHDISESSECEAAEAQSASDKLQARRRLMLRAGVAAAVPVIMTLHAKTAWAGVPPPGTATAYGTSQTP
jgi:hypothetical protein